MTVGIVSVGLGPSTLNPVVLNLAGIQPVNQLCLCVCQTIHCRRLVYQNRLYENVGMVLAIVVLIHNIYNGWYRAMSEALTVSVLNVIHQ